MIRGSPRRRCPARCRTGRGQRGRSRFRTEPGPRRTLVVPTLCVATGREADMQFSPERPIRSPGPGLPRSVDAASNTEPYAPRSPPAAQSGAGGIDSAAGQTGEPDSCVRPRSGPAGTARSLDGRIRGVFTPIHEATGTEPRTVRWPGVTVSSKTSDGSPRRPSGLAGSPQTDEPLADQELEHLRTALPRTAGSGWRSAPSRRCARSAKTRRSTCCARPVVTGTSRSSCPTHEGTRPSQQRRQRCPRPPSRTIHGQRRRGQGAF